MPSPSNLPLPIEEFAAGLRPRSAVIGLDVGTKTVGLAISDLTRTVATALRTLRHARAGHVHYHLLALADTGTEP